MKPSGYRWPLRAGLATLAAIAFLIGAVLLGASTLLDLPAVKSEAARQLSRAMNGHISWDSLQIRLLPVPRVEMRGVTIDLPGQARARIEQAQARLRLRSLWLGQVEFTAVALLRPSIRLDITPSERGQSRSATDPLVLYRSLIEPLLQAVRNAAPDAVLEIDDGDVELRAPELPTIQVRVLSLRASADARGVDLAASAASDLWDRLNFLGRVEFADLSGQFSLEVVDLKPQAWLDRALSGGALGIDIPHADLRAQLRTDARSALQCDFRLDIASMQIARAGQRLQISGGGVKGAAILRPQDSDVTFSELQVGALLPAAQAALRFTSDARRPQATLDVPRLDLNELRNAVLTLGANSTQVQRYVRRILGGEIVNLRLRAEADTWHELLGFDHLAGSAVLADASIMVPVIEQRATLLGGRIELSNAKIELAVARARLDPSELTDARARFSMSDGAVSASTGFDLDLPQALAIARHALSQERTGPLNNVESAAGRLRGRVNLAFASTNWNAVIDIGRSDASVHLTALPWPVSLRAAQASISPGQVTVSGLQGTVGGSKVVDLVATLALKPELRIESGSGHATLALEEIYPWIRSHSVPSQLLRDIDSISGSVQITLNSLAGALSQSSSLAYDGTVRPEEVRVGMKQLPGPLAITGGAVHVDPSAIRLDRIRAELLDARGFVSGEISDYRGSGLQITASIADAVMAEQCANWIRQRLSVPAQFEPRTPLRFAVERATWSPGQAVDAQGSVSFEAGPEVTVDLRWEPNAPEIRRLVIRDRASEALLGLRVKDHLLKATFSGSIFAQSIAAMFTGAGTYQGQAAGDLGVTFDLEHHGRSSAQGHLEAQALELDELLPTRMASQARINRLDLSADGSTVRINQAEVSWAHQLATISGRIALADGGLIVDLQLDSPGIQIGALLQDSEAANHEPPGVEERSAGARGAEFFSRLWSVPVTGQIQLRSDFVQFQRYRLAPVTAALTLGEDRAELRLHETGLCGLSIPLTVQIVPGGFSASAGIQARKQQLEQVARCLTNERLRLTGEFDASVNLATKGLFDQRLENLEGTVRFESRNGNVKKFALIGNILAMTHIVDSFDHDVERSADGFPYRALEFEGHFSQGRFIVEDLIFDSRAFGLAAVGSVGLADRDTQLTVLVAPFSRLDNLVRKAPFIGYLLGGTLTSIPVQIRGDIRDPTVVPLDPRAIASALTSLFSRALKVPERMMAPFRWSPETSAPPTGH